jgi:hypothetical protein
MWFVDTVAVADGYEPYMSARNHRGSFKEPQHDVIDAANPRGAFDNGVEHRLHVCGRAADDAQHLGGCCLMLQRFGKLAPAIVQLFG